MIWRHPQGVNLTRKCRSLLKNHFFQGVSSLQILLICKTSWFLRHVRNSIRSSFSEISSLMDKICLRWGKKCQKCPKIDLKRPYWQFCTRGSHQLLLKSFFVFNYMETSFLLSQIPNWVLHDKYFPSYAHKPFDRGLKNGPFFIFYILLKIRIYKKVGLHDKGKYRRIMVDIPST